MLANSFAHSRLKNDTLMGADRFVLKISMLKQQGFHCEVCSRHREDVHWPGFIWILCCVCCEKLGAGSHTLFVRRGCSERACREIQQTCWAFIVWMERAKTATCESVKSPRGPCSAGNLSGPKVHQTGHLTVCFCHCILHASSSLIFLYLWTTYCS